MKKIILAIITSASFCTSVFAQGVQLTIDNLNGAGGQTATANGRFFSGTYGGALTNGTINITVLGGPDAASLQPVVSLTGANALFYSGVPGIFLDPTFGAYDVPGVANGGTATLRVLAWTGNANSYDAAVHTNKFYPWNGFTEVNANTFTFTQATGGGGTPPGPPRSLDGMPAMLQGLVPEPSTGALAVLGASVIFVLRRRRKV